MTDGVTGSTVSWVWDALFDSIETDWYLNRWKWNRKFEQGGLLLYYGGNEDGALELFSPGEGNLRFILKPASSALAPEFLGSLIQHRETLMKLRTRSDGPLRESRCCLGCSEVPFWPGTPLGEPLGRTGEQS